ALINLVILAAAVGEIHNRFKVAVSGRGDVAGYTELFRVAAELPGDNASLRSIRQTLVGKSASSSDGDMKNAGGAYAAMRALDAASWMAGFRSRGDLFIPYMILQAMVLWDVHALSRIEDWQRQYGDQAKSWFEALGELEAFASIAALWDEYPDWSMAQWSQSAGVSADAIGHPLLPDDQRVCNDVSVPQDGRVLLVTGSNMSGKSTMLRSIGLNTVLAAIGAPVCAAQMTLSDVQLATSIRVRDDVNAGVSFFMAELNRLRRVVDAADAFKMQQRKGSSSPRVLYLLDEIMQGTNSAERQIAVVHVLQRLINSGAIGSISTHDLELASAEEMVPVIDTVHFREMIETDDDGQQRMVFDYRIRDGVTPTTNALRLLDLVGLRNPDRLPVESPAKVDS
ncbi:MAG: DNA mismatch repair protein, partial [Planctomycetota bacterium]